MIDFRYHLVSIAAVLLALAVGIALGSGFLGGPLLDQLARRVARLDTQNRDLIRAGTERQQILDGYTEFAQLVQPEMVRGTLIGEQVVVFTIEGSDGTTLDLLRDAVEEAGGSVAATITMLAKLELRAREDRDELASIVGATLEEAVDLRRATADALATRVAAASSVGQATPRVGPTADERLETMLEELSEAGYVEVERLTDDVTVPTGAAFLLVGGSTRAAAFDPREPFKSFGARLSERGRTVVAAEPFGSVWGLVQSICEDPSTVDEISTVEGADAEYGQAAAVLGLDDPALEEAGHWGVGSCATRVIPELSQAG